MDPDLKHCSRVLKMNADPDTDPDQRPDIKFNGDKTLKNVMYFLANIATNMKEY